jgi:hypothetical protein
MDADDGSDGSDTSSQKAKKTSLFSFCQSVCVYLYNMLVAYGTGMWNYQTVFGEENSNSSLRAIIPGTVIRVIIFDKNFPEILR